LRKLVRSGKASVVLPAGVIEMSRELVVPAGLSLAGDPQGTVLRAAEGFSGRALLVCEGKGVALSGFTIDGNRQKLERRIGIAPYDRTFASYYSSNGILAERTAGLRITGVTLRNITNFAILVSSSKDVEIGRVMVLNSGSLNERGRNNTSGGILIEEGTEGFTVRDSTFRHIRGNGVWTHSLYTSPRNARGAIVRNTFSDIGRDAIQIGHATEVRVELNRGSAIGYPVDVVDIEGGGTPVAIDTAGNVDRSSYNSNRFENINGKCIDLDGFHDGEIRSNVCRNAAPAKDLFGHYGIVFNNTNPDMQSRNIRVTGNLIDGTKFGGIFVIGRGHTITGNRLINLNKAECDEQAKAGCSYDSEQPLLLFSGIYLGRKAERPDLAVNNTIADNVISGAGMDKHCISAAPGVDMSSQKIARNDCKSLSPSKP
jgi:hypothetical protein